MTMLNFSDGRTFASGACLYFDHHPDDRSTLPRIVLSLWVGNSRIAAIVDTGGAYFICSPAWAELLGVSLGEPIGTDDLIIRGYRYRGDLYRTRIQFVASKGESFDLDVTAFVPRLLPGDEWHFPSFLGLQGCLEFLRFAVDPATNTFFFGPLT
jgi:hypothetical protein